MAKKRKKKQFAEKPIIRKGSAKSTTKTTKPKTTKVPKPRTNPEVAKEYNKQVRRIKGFMRRAEKRGFSFDYELPKKPRWIKKSDVERLKGIKPDYLYTKAIYIQKETGEVISGTQRRAQERKESAAKAARTRQQKKNQGEPPSRNAQILSWIYEKIADYESEYSAKQRYGAGGVNLTHWGFDLGDFYNSVVAEQGQEDVIRRFDAHPEVKDYVDHVMLDSRDQTCAAYFTKFVQILIGHPMSAKQAEMLNEDTDYNEDLDELPY